jgi:hypothetical protein
VVTNGIYTKHLNYEHNLENITIGDFLAFFFNFARLKDWPISPKKKEE